jgi:Zn-dependent peptidase ImmA (M78 family)
MLSVNGYDDNLDAKNILFKDLGISKQAIATKLIEFGFLPNNFYQLA